MLALCTQCPELYLFPVSLFIWKKKSINVSINRWKPAQLHLNKEKMSDSLSYSLSQSQPQAPTNHPSQIPLSFSSKGEENIPVC